MDEASSCLLALMEGALHYHNLAAAVVVVGVLEVSFRRMMQQVLVVVGFVGQAAGGTHHHQVYAVAVVVKAVLVVEASHLSAELEVLEDVSVAACIVVVVELFEVLREEVQRQWKEEAELQMVAADIVVVVEGEGRWTLVEAALVVAVVVALDMHLVKVVVVYALEACQVVAAVVVVEDLQVWLVVESLKREETWRSA